MTTELIYMPTTIWPTDKEWTAKYHEVDANKELEGVLKDKLEGNDMSNSKSDTSKITLAWPVFTIFAPSSISH